VKTEKLPLKKRVKYGVIAGFFYAIIMELFYLSDGDSFSVLRFLFHGVFFGLFMALVSGFRVKKEK